MGAVSPYQQLWRVVEGAVLDAFNRHPDYLTSKGRKSARTSIIKRVTGTVLSFAVQAARSDREAAEKARREAAPRSEQVSAKSLTDAGAGASFSSAPLIHRVRIVNVRLKDRRYHTRKFPEFDRTTEALRREVTERELVAAVERAIRA